MQKQIKNRKLLKLFKMMRPIIWQIVIFNFLPNEIWIAADIVETSNGYFITGRGCGITNQLKYLKYMPDPDDLENHGCTFIELTDNNAPLEGKKLFLKTENLARIFFQ